MDRMLEVVDDRPPYVEMYCDAPLMCASLVNTRRAMASSSPTEQVCWSHGVHCTMDDIANSLGLFKVKVLSNDSQTCLFAISPDMPGRQQAEVMLTAAQQLRDVLSQLQLPSGDSLAAKVTMHAGKYAGAVVGRSAWTYDLFGEDVQLLLDMDRANSPGCILVSDAALNLISNRSGQYTPVSKVMCGGQPMQMHAWTPEEGSSNRMPHHLLQLQQQGAARQQQLAAAAGSRSWSAAQPSLQDMLLPSASARQPWQGHQQQQQQQQQQCAAELSTTIASARAAEAASTSPRTSWHSASTGPPLAAAADEPTSSGNMQQDLRFTEPVLESAYLETQWQPLARMDLLFVSLNLAATLCCIWSSSGEPGASRGQVLLSAWGQWVLLPVAAVWLLASPSSYGRWREVLWVVHRLVSALHVAVLVVLSVLQERGLLLGAASSPAGTAAAAAVTAAGAAVARGALGLQKGRALALLAENLGLKVRFSVHLLTNTVTCALVTFSTLWYFARSSSGPTAGAELQLWDLLQHLLLGWAAPTVLTYLWELDDRLKFLEGLEAQRSKVDDPPPTGKPKDV